MGVKNYLPLKARTKSIKAQEVVVETDAEIRTYEIRDVQPKNKHVSAIDLELNDYWQTNWRKVS